MDFESRTPKEWYGYAKHLEHQLDVCLDVLREIAENEKIYTPEHGKMHHKNFCFACSRCLSKETLKRFKKKIKSKHETNKNI